MIDGMRLLGSLLAATVLCACSSKGDVSIGSGQSSDTTTVDFSIAYVKRVLPTDPADLQDLRDADDLTQQRDLWSKADVFVRDKASPSGVERNITARITGNNFYDVRDLNVAPDGGKLVFAMRGPLMATSRKTIRRPEHLEYDVATDQLRRVIADDVTAEAGHDVSPGYLPDGRIAFVSTHQRRQGNPDRRGKSGFDAQTEDSDEPAFVMHTMAADGSLASIHQTSYNQSHDRDISKAAQRSPADQPLGQRNRQPEPGHFAAHVEP
jgi:hypothetical protein